MCIGRRGEGVKDKVGVTAGGVLEWHGYFQGGRTASKLQAGVNLEQKKKKKKKQLPTRGGVVLVRQKSARE